MFISSWPAKGARDCCPSNPILRGGDAACSEHAREPQVRRLQGTAFADWFHFPTSAPFAQSEPVWAKGEGRRFSPKRRKREPRGGVRAGPARRETFASNLSPAARAPWPLGLGALNERPCLSALRGSTCRQHESPAATTLGDDVELVRTPLQALVGHECACVGGAPPARSWANVIACTGRNAGYIKHPGSFLTVLWRMWHHFGTAHYSKSTFQRAHSTL